MIPLLPTTQPIYSWSQHMSSQNNKNVFDSTIQTIGNTPLVMLPNSTDTHRTAAKLEYMNPGGSIKDRTVLFMIQKAIDRGELLPGGTLIEASSGNTGISTAMIGAILGYKVIITVPEKTSTEKKNTLSAYGAEIVICPNCPEIMAKGSYYSTAKEIKAQTPNSFMLNQYFNQDNMLSHYCLTGPEIWQQTDGQLTHFITGVGSGGTLTGVSKFLKEQNPKIKTIGVASAASHPSLGGNSGSSKIEGIVVDYISPLINHDYIDEFILVEDDDAIASARTLAHKHGILVGLASGAVYHALSSKLQISAASSYTVGIFGDSGRAYLSKSFYI